MVAHSYPNSPNLSSSHSRRYSYNVDNDSYNNPNIDFTERFGNEGDIDYHQLLYNNNLNIYHSTSLNRELEGINLLASRSSTSYIESAIKPNVQKPTAYDESLNINNANLLTPQRRLTHVSRSNDGVSSNKISSSELSPSFKYCSTPVTKKAESSQMETNSISSIRFNPTSLISLPFGYNNNTFTKIRTDDVTYPSVYRKASRVSDVKGDRRFKKFPLSMFGYEGDGNEDHGSESNDSTSKSHFLHDFNNEGSNKSVYNLMIHNDYSANPYKRRYHSLINERRRLLSGVNGDAVDHISLPDRMPKRQRKTTPKPRQIISDETLEEAELTEEFLLKKQKQLIAYSLPSLSAEDQRYIESIDASNKPIEDVMLKEMIEMLTHCMSFSQNVYNALNDPDESDQTRLYNEHLFTEENLLELSTMIKRALSSVNNELIALNFVKGMLKSDYDNINSEESYQQFIDYTYNVKRLKRLFRHDQYTLINSYIDENYYEDVEQTKENYILLTSPSMAFYNGLRCVKGLCTTSDYLFKNNVFTECDSCSGCYLWSGDKKEFTQKGFGTVGAWTLDHGLIFDVMNQNKNKMLSSTLRFVNDVCKVAIAEVRIPKPEFSEFTEYNCVNGYCCSKCCTCRRTTDQAKMYTSTLEHEPVEDKILNFTIDTKIATVDLLKNVMGSCSCYCKCHNDPVHVLDRVVSTSSNVNECYNEAISWYDVDVANIATDTSSSRQGSEHIVQERVILRVKMDSIPLSWKLKMPFTCKLDINLNTDSSKNKRFDSHDSSNYSSAELSGSVGVNGLNIVNATAAGNVNVTANSNDDMFTVNGNLNATSNGNCSATANINVNATPNVNVNATPNGNCSATANINVNAAGNDDTGTDQDVAPVTSSKINIKSIFKFGNKSDKTSSRSSSRRGSSNKDEANNKGSEAADGSQNPNSDQSKMGNEHQLKATDGGNGVSIGTTVSNGNGDGSNSSTRSTPRNRRRNKKFDVECSPFSSWDSNNSRKRGGGGSSKFSESTGQRGKEKYSTTNGVTDAFGGNLLRGVRDKLQHGSPFFRNKGVRNFKFLEDFTFWDALDLLKSEMVSLHNNMKKERQLSRSTGVFDGMEIDTSAMSTKTLVLNKESFATDSKDSYVEIALYLPYVPSHILPWQFVSVDPAEILMNRMNVEEEGEEDGTSMSTYENNMLKEYKIVSRSFKRVAHFMKMWINSRNEIFENEKELYEMYKRKWHIYINSFDRSKVDVFSWGVLPVRAIDLPDKFIPLPAGYRHNNISYPYINNETISPFHIQGFGIADIVYRKRRFSQLTHTDEAEKNELPLPGTSRHRDPQLGRRKTMEDAVTSKVAEPDTQARSNAYLMPVFSNLTGPSVRWTQCLMDGPKEPLEWIPDFKAMPIYRVMKCPEMNFYTLDALVVYDRKNVVSEEELLEDELNYRVAQVWSMAEVKTFVEKYLMYPKNFSKIAQFLENKKCGDCVEFYYRFKYRLKLKQRVEELRTRIRSKIDMTKNLKREASIMSSLDDIMDDCNTDIVREFNSRNQMAFTALSDYLLRCGSLDSAQEYYVKYTQHQEPQTSDDDYQYTLDNIAEGYFLPSKYLSMTTRKTVEYTASALPGDHTVESKKGCFIFDYSEQGEGDKIDAHSDLAKSFVVSLNFESFVNTRCRGLKKTTLSNIDRILYNYERPAEFYQGGAGEKPAPLGGASLDRPAEFARGRDERGYLELAPNYGYDTNPGMLTRKKVISQLKYGYESPRYSKQPPRPRAKKKPSKWTIEEKMTYRAAFREHGKDWAKLYDAMAPYGKSLDQIKNFYHKNNFKMKTDESE
ncbi:silencing mediator for retinoid and thyroid hormone receptor [Theileria orientalis strain Shintoku]|uniref:Silencing mediator for retinoid and thyroid hormone receptor n=1 Tax=Theileria orientalis strain Shintoku TaxID=869250 RepID=J4C972_THEOR|nr:silencing mediator for retinoid and thyroid hormone receptor [Theileria orientalis strain Shintoku]BAM42033.1 silencing mediator for retinoid and thyroid hormone receptor [Theileria orientalis strain Shintoku]|eukprot:XP_009692334.1 silencing mediator for retinoid and thyroid hormone receptor [Theileria orientalis strain Shintoku]